MKHDTPLDSAVFRLKDGRTRCELWVTAGETSEKLASGSLTPFLSHLETAQEQLARGVNAIQLQPPLCPIAWFTKRTIERFVRFVSTPDVLERVSALETERVKLAETSNILVSEPRPQAKVSLSVAATPVREQGTDNAALEVVQKISSDSLDVEAETSRKRLLNAMDARLLILQKEQSNAFARAAAVGFRIDSLPDLIAFADCFGATRLREACMNFSALHKRMQGCIVGVDEEGTHLDVEGSRLAKDYHIKPKVSVMEDRNAWSPERTTVVNYGRRRVWGPPVVEISPQKPRSSVDEVLSPSHDSDWDESDDNSKKPIYANVIAELEMGTKGCELPSAGCGQEPTGLQVQHQAAIRRKGIIVVKTEDASKKSDKHSDSESDKDSVDGVKIRRRPGRLSVQDAIHLFESKKQPNDVLNCKAEVSGAEKRMVQGKIKPDSTAEKTSTVSNGKNHAKNPQDDCPQIAGTLQPMNPTCVDGSAPVFDPAVNGSEILMKTCKLLDSAQRPGDMNKDLLDRSYNCLLKINSVVQDALFPKQAALQEQTPKSGDELEGSPWRPLSNTPGYVLDDMFIDSRTPSAASIRRQSLCTPSEYNTKPAESTRRPPLGPDSPHQKGRLYDQYQEIREAKKRELVLSKADGEAKLKAMQDMLERRKSEMLLTRKTTTRFPSKLNTLNAEQMHVVKSQAMTNSNDITNRKGLRPDKSRILKSEVFPSQKTANMQRSTKAEPLTSRMTGATKTSAGHRGAAPSSLQSSSRLITSPSSSRFPNLNHRRLSQSVIAEVIPRVDLRKENAKPLSGNNLKNNSQITTRRQLKSNVDQTVRRNSEPRKAMDTGVRNTVRRNGVPPEVRGMEQPVLAPLKVAPDLESPPSRKYQVPTSAALDEDHPSASKQLDSLSKVRRQLPSLATWRAQASEKKEEAVKPNDECIKQIVSCIHKDKVAQDSQPQQHNVESSLVAKVESFRFISPAHPPFRTASDIGYDISTWVGDESFKEQFETTYQKSQELCNSDCSRDLDEDMQIDIEPLVKCFSGKSLTEGSSFDICSRLAPSHSLPHLEQSHSPGKSIRAETESKDRHKDQPRGLKRLLNFGRRNRVTENNAAESSTIHDDKLPGSNSVRRSLEALPKIADAASEISRNFFSTFRTKSSSTPRAK